MVVGTAGHIDHGKSALVRALTGIDPDRLKEEQARGITIDLGFAHTRIGDLHVAFVDVPGHERFVKNMLAGVGGIDAVLLVVAADESVMPQTREHFQICRLLEIPSGVVALSKADLVDEDVLEIARADIRQLVEGSFLASAPMVAVSSRTGEGLDALRAALADVARGSRSRVADGPVRLPIDRAFTIRGFGTVATGTLVSGRVRPGDELVLLPGAPVGRRVTVRGVQVHAQPRDAAAAGERVALNLSGVDVADVERGRTLVTPSAFESTRVFDATLELLATARAIKHGARVRFHHGTAEVLGRVSIIGVPSNGESLQIRPGERAFVRVRLEGPAVVARGDRYIVRAYSPPSTIGGGVVLDPVPPRTAIRTASATERCQRLEAFRGTASESEVAALALMVEESGERGLPIASIASRAGIHAAQIESRVGRLAERGTGVRVGPIVIATAALDRLASRTLALLGEHHRTQPLSDGLPREEVRGKLLPRGEPAVFDRVIETLVGRGSVAGRDRLALTTHRAAPTTEESRGLSDIERTLAAAGLTPPTVAELAEMTGLAPALVERLIRLLIREKRAARVDALVFHADALHRLKEEIAVLKGTGLTELDVATFKQRFKVTRKFAIPLLEYLDRERVTRRLGERRTIL